MKIRNWISILLFITSFSLSIIAHRNDFIDLFIESDSREIDVDPTDRVDINLWNKLNDEEIKNMPLIDDYSSEINAHRWLKWRSRISLRYHQVDLHRCLSLIELICV